MSFPRFVPSSAIRDCPPAKPAKPANPEAGQPQILATLAGLAATQSRRATPEADRIARLDAERNERDRLVECGCDNELPGAGSAEWARGTVPDSRHPLIPPKVRAKIEAIETDARAKGWPAELLYNANFWDSPRGLAAVLDPEDEIMEVTPEFIAILKTKRDLLKFRRSAA